jgi:hypothetical protein
MKRKGRTSMDRCVQILEMHRAGHSINKIAKALKMCKKTVRKVIEGQGVSEVLNSLRPEKGFGDVPNLVATPRWKCQEGSWLCKWEWSDGRQRCVW